VRALQFRALQALRRSLDRVLDTEPHDPRIVPETEPES